MAATARPPQGQRRPDRRLPLRTSWGRAPGSARAKLEPSPRTAGMRGPGSERKHPHRAASYSASARSGEARRTCGRSVTTSHDRAPIRRSPSTGTGRRGNSWIFRRESETHLTRRDLNACRFRRALGRRRAVEDGSPSRRRSRSLLTSRRRLLGSAHSAR